MLNDMMYGYPPDEVSNRAWNGLFDWTQNNRITDIPNYLTNSTDMMRGISYVTRNITPKVSLIPYSTISAYCYGGILHPNGNIYMIPDTGQVTEFNPYSEKFTTFGALGASTNKYGGGCLGLDSRIYCSPFQISDNKTIVINTYNKRIGLTDTIGGGLFGSVILAQNGLLYFGSIDPTGGSCAVVNPYSGQTKIIPITSAATEFGLCTLAPNGLIYCAPSESNEFLIINPYTDTTKTYPAVAVDATIDKYKGIVLAPNGKLYCVPGQAKYVMVIDPLTNTTKLIGGQLGTVNTIRWWGGSLAPDGCIYCMPHSADSILKINPDTEEVTFLPNIIAGSSKFIGATMHPNGCMYGMPSDGDAVLKLDFGVSTSYNGTLCREYNKQ